MKTEKGFAAILLLSLLPLILAGGFALLLGFGFLRSDMAVLNVCRAEQMQVQNKVGRNLGKLLKLNPKALKLRLEQARAEKALQAAIESGYPPAIAAAEAYLLSVQMRRQALDVRQRALIDTANIWLASSGTSLQRSLAQEWRLHNNPLTAWWSGTLLPKESLVPQLAVKADFPEVAPLYLTVTDFENAQAWKQTWQLKVSTSSWVRKFLSFNGSFDRTCTTSLYQEGEEWVAKLKKDKSSLKGFL